MENDRTGELYGGADTVDELCRRGGRRLGGGVEYADEDILNGVDERG